MLKAIVFVLCFALMVMVSGVFWAQATLFATFHLWLPSVINYVYCGLTAIVGSEMLVLARKNLFTWAGWIKVEEE